MSAAINTRMAGRVEQRGAWQGGSKPSQQLRSWKAHIEAPRVWCIAITRKNRQRGGRKGKGGQKKAWWTSNTVSRRHEEGTIGQKIMVRNLQVTNEEKTTIHENRKKVA